MTRDFIDRAGEVEPIAFIVEGTRINDKEVEESEELVYQQSNQIVSETKRIIFADFNF